MKKDSFLSSGSSSSSDGLTLNSSMRMRSDSLRDSRLSFCSCSCCFSAAHSSRFCRYSLYNTPTHTHTHTHMTSSTMNKLVGQSFSQSWRPPPHSRFKNSEKTSSILFHSAQNIKRGPNWRLWDFLTSIRLRNIKKNVKGDTLRTFKNCRKKSGLKKITIIVAFVSLHEESTKNK